MKRFAIVCASSGESLGVYKKLGQAAARWSAGTWIGRGTGETPGLAGKAAIEDGQRQQRHYVSTVGKYVLPHWFV